MQLKTDSLCFKVTAGMAFVTMFLLAALTTIMIVDVEIITGQSPPFTGDPPFTDTAVTSGNPERQAPSFTGTADTFGTPHLYEALVEILEATSQNHNQTMYMMKKQQETLDQIAETQSQMANTFDQIVTILQMDNKQVQNMAVTLDTVMSVLENQQESLANMTSSLPRIMQQQQKGVELMETQLSVSMSNPGSNPTVGSMTGNQPGAMLDINGMMQNLTTALNQQLDIETQMLLLQVGPRDCSNIASTEYNAAYCDAKTDAEGWTVFQRRYDGSINFYRGWEDYERGFGGPDGEYWAGLRKLHEMTQSGQWILRIELESFDKAVAFAEYDAFEVGDASSNYTLTIGNYSAGDAGDSLGGHNSSQFTTYDMDHDNWTENCAEYQKSAWWHRMDCGFSNLNGLYGKSSSNEGVWWYHWKGIKSIRKSVMKMKRME